MKYLIKIKFIRYSFCFVKSLLRGKKYFSEKDTEPMGSIVNFLEADKTVVNIGVIGTGKVFINC